MKHIHIRMVDAPPTLSVERVKAAVEKVYAERAAQKKAQQINKKRLLH
ncbi:hypothetical protein GA0116948_11784 [Chitinophaga costaii]|uniref:Uncharacterized protein n=1 Tax=Chitinophaga costaii TaxID=1335309 RepID=A0A1C4FW75_9BACT|nr:hypothetical protein [Chitinophaga costaii]SCC60116.1 hypothetical protein GA0116948_11784 [Chitinophaga costaii]